MRCSQQTCGAFRREDADGRAAESVWIACHDTIAGRLMGSFGRYCVLESDRPKVKSCTVSLG